MEGDNNVFLRHRFGAVTIDNTHTDVAALDFDDRLFILITQFEKVGSLVLASSCGLNVQTTNSSYTTKVLLGKDQVELHAFAEFIAGKLQLTKPVLFGIAFKIWPSSEGHKLIVKTILEITKQLNAV